MKKALIGHAISQLLDKSRSTSGNKNSMGGDLFTADVIPAPQIAGKPDVTGYVEWFETVSVRGWAVRPDGSRIRLGLRINGQTHPLDVVWVERADVAQQHGAQHRISGYQCIFSWELTNSVKTALRNGDSIEVIADDVALPILATMPTPATLLLPETLAMNLRTPEVSTSIDSWGHFTLQGWAVVGGREPHTYSLLCNGKPIECTVLTNRRRDVAHALGIQSLDTGFEIELPGYLWEFVPENEDARIDINADGAPLTLESLVLSRAKAACWVKEISRMGEGQEKQYRTLLALEHVHYGRLGDHLDDVTWVFIREAASQMHLGDYVPVDSRIEHIIAEAPAESTTQLLLWQALRALNARLSGMSESVFSHIKAVLQEMRLVGEVRENYLFSVVPLLCRSGEFSALRELLDFSRLTDFEGSYDLWQMSLAPPALVADRKVEQATALFWRIANHLDRGWLNTECVRFTLEEALRLESEGAIEPIVAEKLRYSFIGLLDSFNGEWFSRLHDQELIDAMLSLLAGIGNYTDHQRKDVIDAAIRVYGLNPTFWSRLAVREIDHSAELERAFRSWESLSDALTDRARLLAERLPAILLALEYFQRHGNPEAVVLLREVVANALPELNKTLTPTGRRLIERLLESRPEEALRIAAAPLETENQLPHHFTEAGRDLPATLRRHTHHACSAVFRLQEEAAELLNEAKRLAAENLVHELPATLNKLEVKATLLGNWGGLFLGVALLAQGYRTARSAGISVQNQLLMRLAEMTRKAIAETAPNGHLPVPVQAALAQLGVLPEDFLLKGYLQEMRALIQQKFGDECDDLFERSADACVLEIAGQAWPADVLVVIYSCRKYLDTRVAAIRATWVQELKARGISYVILVGDGDDTLRDDVLALAVSDRYEDLPKKTLKLFDWVYHQTDAQFVLKIDDDCYLDVGRYFDSLSYLKHPYYGRILRRKEGDMDRLWHQPKSHGLHSRKAIDKSPEPSIYADGGGAYCLSRLAMRKLLEMESTDAGKRLVACSFMEDKMVGDLLAMAGILPSDEDYESYQRRRTFGDAMPVGMWENTFYPCAVTPTKVVHLDTERDLAWVRENAGGTALWPKKLWPTCWKPAIVTNSNQLELLTDAGKSKSLLEHDLVVVAVVRNEMTMLPHFLAHYRTLGVECFIFIDNCSDDGSREYLHGQPDVVLFSADTEYKRSHYGVAWQQAVMGNLCLNKWVLLADADELLVYEGCERKPLADLVAEVDAEGANAVRVDMVDMYPLGDLREADFTRQSPFEAAPWFDKTPCTPWRLGSGWFSNGTGFVSHLRHRLLPNAVPHDFVSQKFALFRYRPWVRASQGLHYAANLAVSSRPCWFAHFKYHAGFRDKVLTEIHRGQHFDNAAEYRRYAAMLTEGKGGFGKEGISKRYEGSASFAAIDSNQAAT